MHLSGKFLEGNQQWNICVGTVETVKERVAECSRELLCVDFTENIGSACEVSSCLKPGEAINDCMTLRIFTSSLCYVLCCRVLKCVSDCPYTL
jgi:hypothetical protein